MTLVNANELGAPTLAQVEAIYQDAFVPELRAPFDTLLHDQVLVLVDPGAAGRARVGVQAGEEAAGAVGPPLGFAVLRSLGPTGWVFLRYLATGVRGQGVGARLWDELVTAMAGAGFTRIIWDVEHPEEPGISAPEARLRVRRIGFYTRLGGQLLPVRSYAMPQESGLHPMLLMAADLGDGPARAMVGDALRAVVVGVYTYRYGLGEDDPLVQEALRASDLGAAPEPTS